MGRATATSGSAARSLLPRITSRSTSRTAHSQVPQQFTPLVIHWPRLVMCITGVWESSRHNSDSSQAQSFGPTARRTNMNTWRLILMICGLVVATVPTLAGQKPANESVPKYDKTAEAVFKGTVDEVKDRHCPVSGGMGSHLILKLTDGTTIEVHLALSKFVTQYDLVFHKGDVLEVTGVKVKFEGVDTIFARKVKRGEDEFLFRDNDGKPLW